MLSRSRTFARRNRRLRKSSVRRSNRSYRPTLEALEDRRLLSGDGLEPNDSFVGARDIGSGSQLIQNLTIDPASDVDFFRWQASSNGTLRTDVLFTHTADGDIDLQVYDALHNLLGRSNSNTDNESVAVPIATGETYFVHVFGSTQTAINLDYQLGLTEIAPDAAEPNDSVAAATSVASSGQIFTGLTIHRADNDDFFRFTAPFDGTISADALFAHADGNLDLFLLDSFETVISSSESLTGSEHVAHSVSAGETVYVWVAGMPPAPGLTSATHPDYDLNINFGSPPSISPISLQQTPQSTAITIPFTVSDADTPLNSLLFGGQSFDQSVVPTGNISFGGSGANRTVTITPTPGATGFTNITLSVSDGQSTTVEGFTLIVAGVNVNGRPTMTPIVSQTLNEDQSTGTLFFTVDDDQTPAGDLVVTATSSDQALIPNSNITLGGTGANRWISVTPGTNLHGGPATITVSVTDTNGGSGGDVFAVVVNAVADQPNLSVQNATGAEDSAIGLSITPWLADADGSESLAVSVADVPFGGTLSAGVDNGGGTWTLAPDQLSGLAITPAPNADSNFVLTVTATATESSNGDTASRVTALNVTVNPVNDNPTMSPVSSQTTPMNTPVGPIFFTVDDVETDAGSLVVFGSSANPTLLPQTGIVVGGGGGSRNVVLTPAPGQTGSVLVTLFVQDSDSGSSTRQFLLNVGNANPTAPVISPIANALTSEDTPALIGLTVSDAETSVGGLVLSGSSSNATLVPNENIAFSFNSGAQEWSMAVMPTADLSGVTDITVTVDDGQGLQTSRTFQLTVVAVNDPPTISLIPDQVIAEDSSSTAIGFVISDKETPASALLVSATSNNPTLIPNGSIVFGGSGASRNMVITPAADQSGNATITLMVNDGTGTSLQTFNVTVTPVNDPPTVSQIPDQDMPASTTLGPLPFTVGDDITSPGALFVTGVSSNEVLIPSSNIIIGGSGANRTVTLSPTPGLFGGPVVVTIHVSDGEFTSTELFTVTVATANDPPTISPPISNRTINEGASTGTIFFTISDDQTPVDALVVTAWSSNSTIIPDANIFLSGSGAGRSITVTPPTDNFGGPVTITLNVSDGQTSSNESFTVTINPVNDEPTFNPIVDQSVDQGSTTQTVIITGVDPGNPPESGQSVTLTATSNNPSVVPNPTLSGGGGIRTLSYTPAPSAAGTATITVVATDDGGTANGGDNTFSRTFVITVSPVNQPPTLAGLSDRTTNEDISSGPFQFTVDDFETNANLLSVTASSDNQALVNNANLVLGGSGSTRTLMATPSFNQIGTANITVTVTDADGASTSDSFVLVVQGVNDRPTFDPIDEQFVNENDSTQTLTITGIGPGGGADEAGQAVSVVATSSDPSIVPAPIISGGGAARTLSFTPAADANGPVTIIVTATDNGGTDRGGADTFSRTFVINVRALNDPPTISNIPNQSVSEDRSTGPIGFTVNDIDTDPNLLSVTAVSDNQTLVPNANLTPGGSGTGRSLVVTPASNQIGTATITVTVTDTDGASSSDTFVLTVNPVNDPPVFNAIANQSVNEDSGTHSVVITGVGPGGGADESGQTVSFTAASSDPSIVPDPTITGSGTSRTLSYTLAPDASGTVTIIVTAGDNGGVTGGGADSFSRTFSITVNPVNDRPSFNPIANQTVNEDSGLHSVTVTGVDANGGGGEANQTVTLTATSSNPSIVPNPTVAGTGATRLLRYAPATDASGTVTITVTAKDDGGTAGGGEDTFSRTFTITVIARNDLPKISDISNQSTDEDTPTGPISFTIDDIETAAAQLTVTATSNNQTLVPNANIVLGGSGGNRTLSITPAANQNGTATITVTVDDGDGGQATDSFVLTVIPSATVLHGDVNLDGQVNGLDVNPFTQRLLVGPYQAEADMNDDGQINGLDADPFVDAVLAGSFVTATAASPTSAPVVIAAAAPMADAGTGGSVSTSEQTTQENPAAATSDEAPQVAPRRHVATRTLRDRSRDRRDEEASRETLSEQEQAQVWTQQEDWLGGDEWL